LSIRWIISYLIFIVLTVIKLIGTCFSFQILDDGIDKPSPREGNPAHPEPAENYCLIRMKAKNKKLSAVVKKSDIPKVMESYGKIMKANMDGLKKVKRVKNKSKALQG
jgi:signal recognition particle subunit SRP14